MKIARVVPNYYCADHLCCRRTPKKRQGHRCSRAGEGGIESLELNDFDRYLLVTQAMNTLYRPEVLRTKSLHAADTLRRMSYHINIGSDDARHYYLMTPFVQQIYSKPYFDHKGSRLYLTFDGVVLSNSNGFLRISAL